MTKTKRNDAWQALVNGGRVVEIAFANEILIDQRWTPSGSTLIVDPDRGDAGDGYEIEERVVRRVFLWKEGATYYAQTQATRLRSERNKYLWGLELVTVDPTDAAVVPEAPAPSSPGLPDE